MGLQHAERLHAYEAGELTWAEILELFSELVADGTVWELQGSYGRAAAQLIGQGILSETGEIREPIDRE